MNGVELAAKIQGLQPSIRVLFMPGYQREHRVGPSQLLAKPFANDELLAKLESTPRRSPRLLVVARSSRLGATVPALWRWTAAVTCRKRVTRGGT